MDLLLVLLLHTTSFDAGGLSYYAPGDGYNHGILACGGEFTWEQDHLAYRAWHKMGCDRPVLVCAEDTLSCSISRVRDAGPFGIKKGNRWKVHVGQRAPKGWHFRAVTDLSHALWRRLGKPRPLSRVYMMFFPRPLARIIQRLERLAEHPRLSMSL